MGYAWTSGRADAGKAEPVYPNFIDLFAHISAGVWADTLLVHSPVTKTRNSLKTDGDGQRKRIRGTPDIKKAARETSRLQ